MHHRVLESKRRRMIPLNRLSTILFTFSNRCRLLPRQITSRRNKLLHICDGGKLVGFASVSASSTHLEHFLPYLLAGRGFVEQINRDDLISDRDSEPRSAFVDVLQVFAVGRNADPGPHRMRQTWPQS